MSDEEDLPKNRTELRQGVRAFRYSDIVEENGKTIKESNLQVQHRFDVGQQVLIQTRDESHAFNYKRGTISRHTRDCDGTPLYSVKIELTGIPEDWLSDFGEFMAHILGYRS